MAELDLGYKIDSIMSALGKPEEELRRIAPSLTPEQLKLFELAHNTFLEEIGEIFKESVTNLMDYDGLPPALPTGEYFVEQLKKAGYELLAIDEPADE